MQVNGVPNARLTPGAWIDRLFRAQGGHGTLADLHAREGGQTSGVDPEVFRKLGEQANLDVHIAFNNADPTCFDVLLRTKEAAMAGPVGPPPLPVELSSLANDPMMWRRNENLRRRLRTFLKGELPDYAVPAHIVVLPWMPPESQWQARCTESSPSISPDGPSNRNRGDRRKRSRGGGPF